MKNKVNKIKQTLIKIIDVKKLLKKKKKKKKVKLIWKWKILKCV